MLNNSNVLVDLKAEERQKDSGIKNKVIRLGMVQKSLASFTVIAACLPVWKSCCLASVWLAGEQMDDQDTRRNVRPPAERLFSASRQESKGQQSE